MWIQYRCDTVTVMRRKCQQSENFRHVQWKHQELSQARGGNLLVHLQQDHLQGIEYSHSLLLNCGNHSLSASVLQPVWGPSRQNLRPTSLDCLGTSDQTQTEKGAGWISFTHAYLGLHLAEELEGGDVDWGLGKAQGQTHQLQVFGRVTLILKQRQV